MHININFEREYYTQPKYSDLAEYHIYICNNDKPFYHRYKVF